METERVSDVVKTEVTRETIGLIFGIAGAIASVVITRHLMDNPDTFSYYRMYLALRVKRYADRRVDWWQRVAGRAANIYNEEKY